MHGGQSNSMYLEVVVNQQKEKKARHATPGLRFKNKLYQELPIG
jgi:hypothetical protein